MCTGSNAGDSRCEADIAKTGAIYTLVSPATFPYTYPVLFSSGKLQQLNRLLKPVKASGFSPQKPRS